MLTLGYQVGVIRTSFDNPLRVIRTMAGRETNIDDASILVKIQKYSLFIFTLPLGFVSIRINFEHGHSTSCNEAIPMVHPINNFISVYCVATCCEYNR